MANLLEAFRSRLLPALLTASGVVLITAGLLSYGSPTTAGTIPDESEQIIGEITSDPPSPTPSPTPSPSGSPDASPSSSLAPSPSPTKSPTGRETATRVVMPALNIDLPIVLGTADYPYCNVAMYLSSDRSAELDVFGQPPEPKVTYIYAHARDGMFGPIYNLAIQKRTPNRMLGMLVLVYTSYNRLYTYEVYQVRLHVTSLDAAIGRARQEVWLQTSEGPKGTKGKTQVLTRLLSVEDSTQAESQPKPKIVRCG